mmetsp:Transcript_25331/g.59106  ORF Transcript_25331/g.59106 Transcript_25331/m.59106 type:complete len:208 (-) Transcript_25331:828-1451(-)
MPSCAEATPSPDRLTCRLSAPAAPEHVLGVSAPRGASHALLTTAHSLTQLVCRRLQAHCASPTPPMPSPSPSWRTCYDAPTLLRSQHTHIYPPTPRTPRITTTRTSTSTYRTPARTHTRTHTTQRQRTCTLGTLLQTLPRARFLTTRRCHTQHAACIFVCGVFMRGARSMLPLHWALSPCSSLVLRRSLGGSGVLVAQVCEGTRASR